VSLAGLALLGVLPACSRQSPAPEEPTEAPAPDEVVLEPEASGGQPAHATDERPRTAPPEAAEPAPATADQPPTVPVPPEDVYVLGPVEPQPSGPAPVLAPSTGVRVHVERYSDQYVRSLSIEPSLSIDVPFPLTGPYLGTHERRDEVRDCRREWQREYARVANAALPLDALVLHLGREPFCRGASFDGVQLRVYAFDSPVSDVVEAIRRGAGAEVARLPPGIRRAEADGPPGRWTPQRAFDGWVPVLVRYTVFYGDYGGQAQMDFHVRRFGEHTIVLLLMYVHAGVYEGDGERHDPFAELMTGVRSM